MKCLNIIVNLLLLLTSVEALLNQFFLNLLTDGDEWSTQLETKDALDSKEKEDSLLLCIWKG